MSGNIVTLFNPRQNAWEDHFRWNGPVLVGLTPEGRATIAVLQMNTIERVAVRRNLMDEGLL